MTPFKHQLKVVIVTRVLIFSHFTVHTQLTLCRTLIKAEPIFDFINALANFMFTLYHLARSQANARSVFMVPAEPCFHSLTLYIGK